MGGSWEHLEQIPTVMWHLSRQHLSLRHLSLSFPTLFFVVSDRARRYRLSFTTSVKTTPVPGKKFRFLGLSWTDFNYHSLSRQHLSSQHLSISGISQLLLTRFWPNFRGRLASLSQVQGKVKARSRQGQGKVKARSRQGQGNVKVRSRQGQGKVKVRSRQGQGKEKERSRQGKVNARLR